MKILLIEDDAETAGYLVRALKESGHVIDHSGDGEEGLEMAQAGSFDVLVVDRMIPRRDGLSVIAELRKAGDQTPVLILSALGEVDDRVKGLRAGGDDYLTKPYAFSELLARIEVLARRKAPEAGEAVLQAVEGDRAVVIAQLHARTARGRPYSNRYAFGFRFREGRICEAWELLDSVHFQKQQAAE